LVAAASKKTGFGAVLARAVAAGASRPVRAGAARRCAALSFSELLARVEVLARRHTGRGEETQYRVADLELDRLSHRVVRGSEEIALQPREFRLLEYLMKHAGQVVTRTMLLENV
jgi:hypothetical protein